jgi:sporulation integral membrane protein YlbJ
MARLLSNRKRYDALVALGLGLAIASLLLFPSQAVEAARSGLELCGNVIIPSLFPFFVLSSLCVELGLIRQLGKLTEPVMRPLFRVSGTCAAAFLLGIIGGYPVGARTAISLYEKRAISKTEAERLLAFCNNSGPAFILGVVGAGIFSSGAVGLLLYFAHIAASVLVGLCFRFYKPEQVSAARTSPRIETVQFSAAFTGCVKDAFSATLNICAFVIFFSVIIRLLFLSGAMTVAAKAVALMLSPLGLTEQWAEKLLTGMIELSSGVWSLQSAAGTLTGKLSMAAFLLGWAGVSVHCQVLSFIGSTGLSTRTYLCGKFLHGLFSAALVALLARLLTLDAPVSHYYAQQVTGIATMDFSTALTVSTFSAALVWLVMVVLSVGLIRKASRNAHRS